MSSPVRIFVGSGPRYVVEEIVMARSLIRHAGRPVQIDVIDGGEHCLRRFGTGESWPLPDEWRDRVAGATSFTFARFGAPELCGWEGRAIYCESDQLALGDVTELWDHPLGDAAFAAVPFEDVRTEPPPYQSAGHLSSVMVFDASRCRSMSVPAITDDIRQGHLTYEDGLSLSDRFLDRIGLRVASLPARWNDLEQRLDDTEILHFTGWDHRPWLRPGHPESDLWIREYLACVDEGLLYDEILDAARRLDGISARIRSLPRLPRSAVRPVDAVWQAGEKIRDRGTDRAQELAHRVRRAPAGVRRRLRRLLDREPL